MGWWAQDKDGYSFVEDSQMVWGDGPADTVGDAIDAIVSEFLEEVGRRPSRDEIHAGIDFCLRAVDEYWDVDTGDWK
jgi:hypothetical protein